MFGSRGAPRGSRDGAERDVSQAERSRDGARAEDGERERDPRHLVDVRRRRRRDEPRRRRSRGRRRGRRQSLHALPPRVGVVPLGALVARHARPPSSRETVALSDGREASAASAARFDGPLGRGARFQSKRTVLGATRGGGGGDGGSRKVHVRVHRGFSGVETLRPRAVSADSRGDGILGGAHRRGNDGSFGDEAARLAEFARAVSARARARHAQNARRARDPHRVARVPLLVERATAASTELLDEVQHRLLRVRPRDERKPRGNRRRDGKRRQRRLLQTTTTTRRFGSRRGRRGRRRHRRRGRRRHRREIRPRGYGRRRGFAPRRRRRHHRRPQRARRRRPPNHRE